MSGHRARRSLGFFAGFGLLSAALPLGLLPFAPFACSSDGAAPATPLAEASTSDASDAEVADDTALPPLDASTIHCTLFDGTDPVGLCAQKVALRSMHSVFTDSSGVPSRWDAKTGIAEKDDAGNTSHDPKDDIAYGAALTRYFVNSIAYGDEELTTIAYGDLPRVATLVEKELAVLPKSYDGALYRNLRYLAVGLRYVDSTDHATKIDALADAYGAAIYTGYYHVLAVATEDAGAAGDASIDSGDSGAANDGGDGGSTGGGSLDDGIFGIAASGAAYSYDSVDAVTGAFALLDMALNHSSNATVAAAWQRAALSVIDHVWRRARHAPTGMTYRALVTSDDASGDTPAGTVLTADVQATIALALLRMRDLVPADAGAAPQLAAYPLGAHAVSAIASLHGASSLWDDAGIGTMAAYDSDGGTIDTTKPTRANALLLGALHRSFSVSASSTYEQEVAPLFARLSSLTIGDPGFLTVIVDQAAYFDAVTRDYRLGDGGIPPYSTAASTAACEGLNELGPAIPGATP